MSADYYLILGVSRHANASQIKRAYRQLSQRYHPDHAGEENAERFLRLKEAYDTLSRAAAREEYDRRLRAAEGRRTGARPEPLRARERTVNPWEDFESYSPSRAEMMDVLLRSFTRRHVPKSRPVRAVTVEVLLTPEQALRGGRVPLEVPVSRVCAVCQGSGQTGFYACDACGGAGMAWDAGRIDVFYPPGAGDGTTIPVSLRSLGVRDLYVNLMLRVAAGTWPA